MSQLPSVPIIIDTLGGHKKVAKFMRTSTAVISNWKSTGRFPAATYVVMQARLRSLGHSAPDKLWTMRKPSRRKVKHNG